MCFQVVFNRYTTRTSGVLQHVVVVVLSFLVGILEYNVEKSEFLTQSWYLVNSFAFYFDVFIYTLKKNKFNARLTFTCSMQIGNSDRTTAIV